MDDMRDDPLSHLYADIDRWLDAYRAACPEDDRVDLDILLDETVYRADSPYWPLR